MNDQIAKGLCLVMDPVLEHFHICKSYASKAARMAAIRTAGFQPALLRQTKRNLL
ncbi:hypothetical protein P4C99_11750 [Pontiellaceae bacterium B1224]|nr:hypothetical protein [Pontiellaceae bacterium B1224]